LEDRLVPAAQTDSSRQLLERIQATVDGFENTAKAHTPGYRPGLEIGPL
jgi:hypothetical protein